jgi:hypothetical protein
MPIIDVHVAAGPSSIRTLARAAPATPRCAQPNGRGSPCCVWPIRFETEVDAGATGRRPCDAVRAAVVEGVRSDPHRWQSGLLVVS